MNFFKQLESLGEGVKGLNLVSLENKGFTVFGMVNAEKARAQLHGKSTTQEKNWYHHKFAIDNKGMVYDFDYSNSPRPTPFNKYVEDMYLNEDECLTPRGGEFCAGRKNKLIDYELKIYEPKDVLELNDRPYWTGSLGQALDKFKP
ncbi:MAG: hypothetical protein EXR74_08940 [Bdellovibrionales bacterium]|nr:hypothetical protein [Bdellovibrionales bacterium]